MRTIAQSFFTGVLVALGVLDGVADAVAQSRKVGRPGVLASVLLTAEPVQEELKLSAEQSRKVKDVVEKDRQTQEAIELGPPDDGDKRWQELLADSEKAVAAILTPAQLKRFKQIRLQHSGALALAEPKLASELKLTEEQQKAIKAIAENRSAKFKSAVADSSLTPREIGAKLAEYTKAADEEILKRLTADQKAKWEEMIGERFRWPKP
jgi:hypothetical protein